MIAAEIESRLATSAREMASVFGQAPSKEPCDLGQVDIDQDEGTTIDVSKILLKTMENMMSRFALKCVEECAKRYGFDLEEATGMLGLKVSIQEKVIHRQARVKEAKAPRITKTKVPRVKMEKEKFGLPFIPGLVKEELCQGLSLNGGLFTQCQKEKKEGCEYCNKCEEKAEESGMTIMRRMSVGLLEFRNNKGQKPVSYISYLSKKDVSRDEAEERARELGVVIPEEYWEVQEKKRGRPKKEEKEVAAVSEENDEEKPKKVKKVLSDEEKEERKVARELAKRDKLAEKERERKAQLEEMKAKEEVKQQEVKQQEVKQQEVKQQEVKQQEAQEVKNEEVQEEAKKITVRKILINGKKYLRTSANVLYDAETKEEVGTYDPINKVIIPLPEEDDDSEVEEEEYSDEEEG
jgi:hypothetical protein